MIVLVCWCVDNKALKRANERMRIVRYLASLLLLVAARCPKSKRMKFPLGLGTDTVRTTVTPPVNEHTLAICMCVKTFLSAAKHQHHDV